MDEELVSTIVNVLDNRMATAIQVFDLKGRCDFADFFILCNAETEKHAQALCDHVEETVKKKMKRRVLHVEGYVPGHWILMDYISVILHIFTPSMREYYGLERLWGDAPDVTKKYTL